MDFITGLPRTKEKHDAILVIVDRLTKWGYFVPTATTIDAKEMAMLFHDVVFARNSMPKRIVSDWDTRFTSHFWRAFFDAMGTSLAMSTSYHPQTEVRLNESTMSWRRRSAVMWDPCNWTGTFVSRRCSLPTIPPSIRLREKRLSSSTTDVIPSCQQD